MLYLSSSRTAKGIYHHYGWAFISFGPEKVAEDITSYIKNRWTLALHHELRDMMYQLTERGQSLGRQPHHIGADRSRRVCEDIAKAKEEIAAILGE